MITRAFVRTPRILTAALALAACQALTGTPTPTPSPTATPTAVPPTPTPVTPTPEATRQPLTEATQPIVLEPPSPRPTSTLAQPPLHLPDARITLFEPGPGSQVRSPFRVIGHGGPSWREHVELRLFGEDGRTLDEATSILFAYPGNAGRFVSDLSFETPHVSELGLIQIDTFDRRYGRMAHRLSQEVVLLSVGSDRVHPGRRGPAQLAITEPSNRDVVQMGTVAVSGGGWSTGAGPLIVEAYIRNGEVVDSTTIELDADEPEEIGTFSASLEVMLPYSQYGRLAISELDGPEGEPLFFYSIEVWFQRSR